MARGVSSLIIALLFCVLWRIVLAARRYCAQLDTTSATAIRQRLLKPRTRNDCPACRGQSAVPPTPTASVPPVRPWRACKSRRGAPKRIATHGFACPNPACAYYRITDATVHALVGDGTHGRVERIQTFRCQACRATFTDNGAVRQPGLKSQFDMSPAMFP